VVPQVHEPFLPVTNHIYIQVQLSTVSGTPFGECLASTQLWVQYYMHMAAGLQVYNTITG
jgi:hypothetical protein